jgi:hypothetical protein
MCRPCTWRSFTHLCIPTPTLLTHTHTHTRAQVKKIIRHRNLPVPIYKAGKLRRTMLESERRKTSNRIAHSAPGSVTIKPARKKKIVAEME